MKSQDFKEQKSPNLILILYLSTAIFVMLAVPFLASRWYQQAFIGGFLSPTLHFKKFYNILSDETWPLQELGFGKGDELTAIDGQPVESSAEISEILSAYQSGDTATLSIHSDVEGDLQIEITLTTFSKTSGFIFVSLPFLIALLCFLSGLWVFSDQRKLTINMAFTTFATSLSIVMSTYYDYFTTHQLVPIFLTGLGIASASLVQIALLFPFRKSSSRKPPWVSYIAYPHNILLIGIAVFHFQNPSDNLSLSIFTWLLVFSLIFSVIIFILASLATHLRLTSPVTKRQFKVLIAAAAISFLPPAVFFIVSKVTGSEIFVNPFSFLSLCVLPITYTMQMRRFLLPQTKKAFLHSMIYFIVAILFGCFYLILIYLLNQIFINPISPENPVILGIMIFLVVFTIDPIRKLVERNMFMPSSSSLQGKTLAMNFSSSLAVINNPDLAVDLLKDIIEKILNPRHIYIYLYDPQIPGYIAKVSMDSGGEKTFIAPHDSVIAQTVEKLRDILYFKEYKDPSEESKPKAHLWDEHGSCIFAPIPGSLGIFGWAAIGPKQNDAPYSVDDIDLISTLIHQFAMVYERVDALTTTKKHLREMEILNHIATAINKNNDFDELLGSIYKEIKSIIPIDRFSLVMNSDIKGFYNRLFLFENGKKLISTNQPKPLRGSFLEETCIRKAKPEIIQDDQTWLVLPLKAGDEIIGALSLGHSTKNQLFDRLDLSLINSISSLVSGAIIKANLLWASQNQAHQLATLNKVSQQLTSTLVLETLLKSILNGAIEILNSSSGILMLADKLGNTLEFSVTAGPIGNELSGMSLRVNEGIAGESFTTRKPVIMNSIDPEKLWGVKADRMMRYRIENVVAIPLIARSVVIGVIEVINKKNKSPFTDNDVNILVGFANQAAIAIHNATLYTQTDKALESRIEELYTMQKIDRDLNSTRDISQALQIILKAGIIHTHASIGSIGLVEKQSGVLSEIHQVLPDLDETAEKDMLEIRDFTWLLQNKDKGYLIKESPQLSKLLGIPQEFSVHHLIDSEINETQSALLFLHTDSSKSIDREDLEFLTRLSDHAMIALKNIYLYQELHEAIQIKNEFISFISHELKNPLTVIKGYADILRKGMAGEINEEQVDFLTTITHNVKQMSTFITDLSDQSQIESKSLRLIFDQTSIVEVIDEVLHTYENQINVKLIDVRVEVNKEIPNVWCDRLRLIQILSNLVSNAIKYTPEGGEMVIDAHHAINEWDEKGVAEVVHVMVQDNGYGISEKDQGQIFEKFFRGTSSHINKIPGSGLGLRISKTLAEMMGGKLWFESTEGKGSTFHFTIPI